MISVRTTLLAAALLLGAVSPVAASDVFPLSPSITVAEADSLEVDGRVPDYLKAVAGANPEAAATLAHLVRTTIFGGTLPPSLKLAMGARIAQQCKTRYALAHIQRLARVVGAPTDERTALAVRYADDLTRSVHGVSDESFAQVKTRFNDAQVVEMTMTTCFFNYFVRLTEGLGLQAESWLEAAPRLPRESDKPFAAARVALSSDDELKMAGVVLERWAPGSPGNSLGVGVPNSLRAMIHVPDLYDAWMGRSFARPNAAPNPNAVSRTILLQVSLAVSTVNDCRYCTLHQVVGLRRQGVEVSKLLAMQKDDSALTAEEKAAVDFARKLTVAPGSLTEADRAALQKSFPGAKAFEVLHQTCRFAFMNRFTDGLRLPSEDEAIHIYKETYGRDYADAGKGTNR